MNHQLTDSGRAAIEDFLYQITERDRSTAIEKMANSPEKEAIACYLRDYLLNPENEIAKDDWRRTWCITALGALKNPETVQAVMSRIDPEAEHFEWARYWAVVALARMMPAKDIKSHLTKIAESDASGSVKAVALRVLVEMGFDDKYLARLLAMITDRNWDNRRAACKALRSEAAILAHPCFKDSVEHRLLHSLGDRLRERTELADIRYQAAQAMKSIGRRKLEAVQILSEALKHDMPDAARRVCVEALTGYHMPEAKDALLFALEDDDAEIRQRAAKGLQKILNKAKSSNAPGAVEFIIEHLLRVETSGRRYDKYIEALRQIDGKRAATILSQYLFDPNPMMVDRTSQALTELGGEAALRTLQAQRTQAVEKYTELLGDADKQIMMQFESLMQRARVAFTLSMVMHGIIFLFGLGTLVASLSVALNEGETSFRGWVGVGGTIGSLGTLVMLFYRDPLKNIGQSVTNLIKVNVVFLGYIRQINQIDATFKQLFLDTAGFSIRQMKDTVAEIETSVDKTLSKVQLYLELAHSNQEDST